MEDLQREAPVCPLMVGLFLFVCFSDYSPLQTTRKKNPWTFCGVSKVATPQGTDNSEEKESLQRVSADFLSLFLNIPVWSGILLDLHSNCQDSPLLISILCWLSGQSWHCRLLSSPHPQVSPLTLCSKSFLQSSQSDPWKSESVIPLPFLWNHRVAFHSLK